MAITSPFSDVAWVRKDLPSIEVEDFSNIEVTEAIKDGDKELISDLNSLIDFSEISSVPAAIGRLSHYKACEIVLIRVINNPAVVAEENSLANYWEKKYDKLKKAIYKGEVRLLDSSHDEYEADEVIRTDPLGRIV